MPTFKTLKTWFPLDNEIAAVIYYLVEIVAQEILLEYVLDELPYEELLNHISSSDEVIKEMLNEAMIMGKDMMEYNVRYIANHEIPKEIRDGKLFLKFFLPKHAFAQRVRSIIEVDYKQTIVYGDASPVFAQRVRRIVKGKLVHLLAHFFQRNRQEVSGVSQFIEGLRNFSEEVLKKPRIFFIGPLTEPVLNTPQQAFYYATQQAFWRLVNCTPVNNCEGDVGDVYYKCIVNSTDPNVLNATRDEDVYSLIDLVEEIDRAEEKFQVCREAQGRSVKSKGDYFCVIYVCDRVW